MEREEYIKQLGYYGDLRLLGNDEFITVKMNLLAEFDRLKAEVERLLQINQEANRNIWRLQSQLDKISEPYHYSRDKAEYPWIRHEGKADGCPICRLKPLSGKLP